MSRLISHRAGTITGLSMACNCLVLLLETESNHMKCIIFLKYILLLFFFYLTTNFFTRNIVKTKHVAIILKT